MRAWNVTDAWVRTSFRSLITSEERFATSASSDSTGNETGSCEAPVRSAAR
jgi:hypothetical protein